MEESAWLTVRQFLSRHDKQIGRTKLYELIKAREIPFVRIGRKVLLPADLLDRLLVPTNRDQDLK